MKRSLEEAARAYALGEITKSRIERAEKAFKAGADWFRCYLVDGILHKVTEQPENGRVVLALREFRYPVICGPDNTRWEDSVKDYGIVQWVYVDDLFPSSYYEIIKARWEREMNDY